MRTPCGPNRSRPKFCMPGKFRQFRCKARHAICRATGKPRKHTLENPRPPYPLYPLPLDHQHGCVRAENRSNRPLFFRRAARVCVCVCICARPLYRAVVCCVILLKISMNFPKPDGFSSLSWGFGFVLLVCRLLSCCLVPALALVF